MVDSELLVRAAGRTVHAVTSPCILLLLLHLFLLIVGCLMDIWTYDGAQCTSFFFKTVNEYY